MRINCVTRYLARDMASHASLLPLRSGAQGPLKNTAWEWTQAPLKAEPSGETVASTEKAKGREGEEEKEKDKEKFEECDAQKKEMVEEVQRAHHSSVYDEKWRMAERRRKAKEVLGEIWEVALPLVDSGEELAQCQCGSRRISKKNGGGDKHAAGSADQRKKSKGESPKMVEAAKRVRHKGNGGRSKSTAVYLGRRGGQRKCMRRYKRKERYFFWIEHKLRKEEMEKQFNREAKEGWRFAADAARITDERAGGEDQKHTSGGVFVSVDSNLGAVVGAEEGTIVSISGIVGRIAQAWVNVRGSLRVFSVYIWHSEGCTPEA